jgi:hypothetical protein
LTGHLGVVKVDVEGGTYKPDSFLYAKVGVGVRAGVRFPLESSFALQTAADIVALSSGTRLVVGRTLLVDLPPVLIGAGVTGIWEF